MKFPETGKSKKAVSIKLAQSDVRGFAKPLSMRHSGDTESCYDDDDS